MKKKNTYSNYCSYYTNKSTLQIHAITVLIPQTFKLLVRVSHTAPNRERTLIHTGTMVFIGIHFLTSLWRRCKGFLPMLTRTFTVLSSSIVFKSICGPLDYQPWLNYHFNCRTFVMGKT